MNHRTRNDRLASGVFFLVGIPATLVVPALCLILLRLALPVPPSQAFPLILPSLVIAVLALGFSAPLGIGTALFASEFLREQRRRLVGLALEGLGALPPVCCAWFSSSLLAPVWVQGSPSFLLFLVLAPCLLGVLSFGWPYLPPVHLDRLLGLPLAFLAGTALAGLAFLLWSLPVGSSTLIPPMHSSLGAGLTIAMFLAPKVAARTLAILSALPSQLREASISCGSTRWETARRVVLPQTFVPLCLVLLELLTWAFGETMVVLVLCGSTSRAPWQGATLSSSLAIGLPETAPGSISEQSLVWSALILLATAIAAQIPNRLLERKA